jgi:ABC-2 type transport system permease protein
VPLTGLAVMVVTATTLTLIAGWVYRHRDAV